MTAIYIFWDDSPHLNPILHAAPAGTIVCSDKPRRRSGLVWIKIPEFKSIFSFVGGLRSEILLFGGKSFARWLVLAQLLKKGVVKPPFLFPDWDEFVLDNSVPPAPACDFIVTKQDNYPKSPICFFAADPVYEMCSTLQRLVPEKLRNSKYTCDMEMWLSPAMLRFKPFDASAGFKDRTTYDHHVCSHQNNFKMAGGSKIIRWDKARHKAYFTHASGIEYAARTLHCWGPWKRRFTEVSKHLGL